MRNLCEISLFYHFGNCRLRIIFCLTGKKAHVASYNNSSDM